LSGLPSYPEKYEQAEKALAGTDKYHLIESVHYNCEDIRRVWERPADVPASAIREAQGKKPARRVKAPLYRLVISGDSLHNLGTVGGDACDVYEADDLKPGDAAAIDCADFDGPACGRVVKVTAKTITIRDACGDARIRRAGVTRTGRIDTLNPYKSDPLNDAERKRVTELRQRLARVDADDITNSTSLLKIDREIYDIEHPPVGLDDWSAWEGGGQ
jgi:hypothetical protein